VVYVPENINASKNLVDNSEGKGPHVFNSERIKKRTTLKYLAYMGRCITKIVSLGGHWILSDSG
jgi:hypothetical protein